MKSSLMIIKIILTVAIIVSIGTALGATIYFGVLKNNLPVAVQPTPTITQILTPTVTPTLTPTITPNVDTSDWKIYRNEKYGYEIKYPDLYILDEKGNTAAYDSEKVRLVNFNINYSEITHSSVSANNTDYMNPSAIMKGYGSDKVYVTVDGINTFLYISKKSIKREYDCEFEAPCIDSVFPIELRVKKNTDMFTFSGFFKVDYLDKSIELYKKIFSSFRFLERDENGKIIVYVKKDNYEFQYPDNYFSEPPKITVVNSNISEFPDKCPDIDGGGGQNADGTPFMYRGEKIILNSIVYCRYDKTIYSKGACTNADIDYKTIKEKKLYIINFIGGACCGGIGHENNYTECVKSNEEIPKVVEKVISSFKFTEIDNTADWKTYRNEKYGFEIKYPTQWNYNVVLENQIEFREKGKTYEIEGSDIYTVGIFIYDNTDNQTIKQMYETIKENGGDTDKIKNLVIGNIDAIQTVDYLQENTILLRNNKIYNIATPEFGSQEIDKNVRSVYDKMLSTFNFIEK